MLEATPLELPVAVVLKLVEKLLGLMELPAAICRSSSVNGVFDDVGISVGLNFLTFYE